MYGSSAYGAAAYGTGASPMPDQNLTVPVIALPITLYAPSVQRDLAISPPVLALNVTLYAPSSVHRRDVPLAQDVRVLRIIDR